MTVCPKCLGDTELILTNRDEDGWLVGLMVRKTCDWCEGKGEVSSDRATRPIETMPVRVFDDVTKTFEPHKSWGEVFEDKLPVEGGWRDKPKPISVKDKWGVVAVGKPIEPENVGWHLQKVGRGLRKRSETTPIVTDFSTLTEPPANVGNGWGKPKPLTDGSGWGKPKTGS